MTTCNKCNVIVHPESYPYSMGPEGVTCGDCMYLDYNFDKEIQTVFDSFDGLLESMDDLDLLSKKGRAFKSKFWEKFIKER